MGKGDDKVHDIRGKAKQAGRKLSESDKDVKDTVTR
jgi:hypothetical protein